MPSSYVREALENDDTRSEPAYAYGRRRLSNPGRLRRRREPLAGAPSGLFNSNRVGLGAPAARSFGAATKKSVITVRWLGSNQPVAAADAKLGWGSACGKYVCSKYQKNGKTGAMGRITFKNLPSGPTNWCAFASKGNSYGGNCYTDHNHPIDSAITVLMPKT